MLFIVRTFMQLFIFFFFLMVLLPPRSTLFPYTTLFRSRSQSIFSRSRACFAVQNLSATTVTALPFTSGISNTDRKSTRLELQSHVNLVCRLLLEKKKKTQNTSTNNTTYTQTTPTSTMNT